jgi:hypothetical protein
VSTAARPERYGADPAVEAVRLRRLMAWRDRRARQAILDGAPAFCGKPEAWFEDPTWACSAGHVSGMILKCEEDGDLCLACMRPVILIPPSVGEAELAASGWHLEEETHAEGDKP